MKKMFRNLSIPMPTIIVLFLITVELLASTEGVPRHHQYANNGKSAVSEDTVVSANICYILTANDKSSH